MKTHTVDERENILASFGNEGIYPDNCPFPVLELTKGVSGAGSEMQIIDSYIVGNKFGEGQRTFIGISHDPTFSALRHGTALLSRHVEIKNDKIQSIESYKELSLSSLFLNEVKLYSQYIGDFVKTFNKTKEAIDTISSIKYESVSLELTPDNSIIFSLKFKKDKHLFIELYYSPKGGNKKEAFFSFYKERKCYYNGIGKLSEVFTDIKKILKAEL